MSVIQTHNCVLDCLDPDAERRRGDVFHCPDCGRWWVCIAVDGRRATWLPVSKRRARKLLKGTRP